MKIPLKPKVLAPEGTHVARVISIIEIGTEKTNFGDSKKVLITWELPTEVHKFKEEEGEKPFVVSSKYTLSLHKKSKLRPIVEGILTSLTDDEASNFDLDEILGKECLVNVEYSEDGQWANVKSTSKLIKGMVCPKAINPLKSLSFEKWSQEVYDSLYPSLKERIAKSPEYRKMNGEDVVNESEIPF